ncbi:hypothetical protein [Allobaculum stercoricanis]|uniref:hypothetical protein n=2 Tax=Allobaculum stercoricanis TaxID=174709 RepID=UPI0023F21DE9|nr:hypothetical protein [Allobaculum stercoricanis]
MTSENKKKIHYVFTIMFVAWAILLGLLYIDYVKNNPNVSVLFYVLGIAMIVLVIFDIILIRRKQKFKLSSKGSMIGKVITLCILFTTFNIGLAYTPNDSFGVNWMGYLVKLYLIVGMYYPIYRVFHFF